MRPTTTESARRSLIVDQQTVDRYFPGQDPSWETHSPNDRRQRPKKKWYVIVGVVPHLKVYGYDEPASPLPQFYLPMLQQPQTGLVMSFCAHRPRRKPSERPLRQIVASLDAAQPVFEVLGPCNNAWRKPGRRRG